MRIANEVHEKAAWRVHEVAKDFQLLDVWQFPLEGGGDPGADFDALVRLLKAASATPEKGAAAMLFRLRLWLGKVFGWDDEKRRLPIPGCEETSVRDRLPPDLIDTARPDPAGEFEEVYRTDREALSEISNGTVHALMHLGWVEIEPGRFTGRMAVYVKPRGTLGRLYMGLITPFRLAIVYPAMMRHIGRRWLAARPELAPSAA